MNGLRLTITACVLGAGCLGGVTTCLAVPETWLWQSVNPPTPYSGAYGISGNRVVGTYSSNSVYHGFVSDGTSVTILDAPGASLIRGSGTQAYGISGNSVVGTYTGCQGGGGFYYDGTTWATLDPGLTPLGIDMDAERIVGQKGSHGFLLGYYGWEILDYPGAISTVANGVSGNRIVGTYRDDSGWHGYLWDGVAWTCLDFPGARDTWAYGVGDNNIVGSYDDQLGYTHGFLFNGTSWTTLDYPGPPPDPLDPSVHWETAARGISGNNIVINVSAGWNTPYILTMPEPATITLLSLGLFVARRR